MKIHSYIADVFSMCAFVLPTMRAASARQAGKAEIVTRGIIVGFGGDFFRDLVLMFLVCGVRFTGFLSLSCWAGFLFAGLLFSILRYSARESLLDRPAVRWTLVLLDGGGAVRCLCAAVQSGREYGIRAETILVLLALVAVVGGNLLNDTLRRERGAGSICKWVSYPCWLYLAWVYNRLACEGPPRRLMPLFVLAGMQITTVNALLSADISSPGRGAGRGAAFSFRIGLYLSRGKQFALIKAPGKGRRVLRMIPMVTGDITAIFATL